MSETSSIIALVTGGAGFIGSHLVDRLLASGARVRVLDDFSTGSRANLAHHADDANLRILEGDILNPEAVRDAVEGCSHVFHLACRNVRLSLTHPTIVHEVNATGTLNLLKESAGAGVARFLYCSSSEVNGTADLVPMPELYHYAPETIYGASKLTGEYYTDVFQRAGWLSTVIARPHNNYGPREHYAGNCGEVIPRFILQALCGEPLTLYGDGAQTRDFTYVTETVDYLVRLALHGQATGAYNVCRGEEVTIKTIADTILALTRSSSEIRRLEGRPSDVLRLFGDPARLRGLLGSSPSISIADGLQRTVDWFRAHVAPTPELMASLTAKSWVGGQSEPWLEQHLARRNAAAKDLS
ncbi:MAG TPA: NAD-dependent epimerase/dehydratase family protein [Humidesulfovibrio sp.]|uniref:NAD-dependent epimerase/dehydratase family protein n=1 Tax=Humidesulfovibrio sp. TaxID=2910988 RepID=UPI002D173574|nr:NAD-dependent epimerase/dehydratase family protein [Humidesulfovibrio sp.]HWR03149.1 NAD-dependent epimerase/dehydratase family protein [Humidesulfovibrio sp.]